MNKSFLFPLTVLLLLASCKTTVKGKNGVEYKSAIQYNDYIVNKQMEVIKMIVEFNDDLQIDLAKAEKTIDKSILRINQSIIDIADMPAWKNSIVLRDNALRLFEFYKKSFSQDYKRLIDIRKDGEVSEEEVKEYHQMTKTLTVNEEKEIKNFMTIQSKFALENNFNPVFDKEQKEMEKKINKLNK